MYNTDFFFDFLTKNKERQISFDKQLERKRHKRADRIIKKFKDKINHNNNKQYGFRKNQKKNKYNFYSSFQ